jgi:GxxExxY protein
MTTEKIIGAAIKVHRHLGPGLLESTYEICLAKEFDARGIKYERQKACPVAYKDFPLEESFRVDFLVEGIVLEIKSVDSI